MCEIGKKFSNIKYYNKEMQKGMEDKLFFVDRLPQDQDYVFVDFGCADGTMINALTEIYADNKDNHYVGYDISETMIDIAKTNYHGPYGANVRFHSDWKDVQNHITVMKDTWGDKYKFVLILSSVIHEVYSYGDVHSIHDFWDHTVNSDFDYIIVRDMCPSGDIDRDASSDLVEAIMSKRSVGIQLEQFQNKWGSILNNKNLIHFLLKYRWKVNWGRELNENYFPIYVNDLIENMKSNYKIDYLERFRVPFLDKCFKNDFGIELNDYTHVKAIFSKLQK
jgi:SAM-dependent methyltransferase